MSTEPLDPFLLRLGQALLVHPAGGAAAVGGTRWDGTLLRGLPATRSPSRGDGSLAPAQPVAPAPRLQFAPQSGVGRPMGSAGCYGPGAVPARTQPLLRQEEKTLDCGEIDGTRSSRVRRKLGRL